MPYFMGLFKIRTKNPKEISHGLAITLKKHDSMPLVTLSKNEIIVSKNEIIVELFKIRTRNPKEISRGLAITLKKYDSIPLVTLSKIKL
jgi:hypothetical protein